MLRTRITPLRSFARSLSVSTTLRANALNPLDTYKRRHNGSGDKDIAEMLKTTRSDSMKQFIAKVVPEDVLVERPLAISPEQGLSETQLLDRIRELAAKNKIFKSYIGRGYYGTTIPPVVQRNLLENPQWYTSYTPYQAEIAQGRLESLINFQTMIRDLTGMDLANASLLDEATAAAEAMIMSCTKNKVYYVHEQVLPQTLSVLRTRAAGLGIEIRIGLPKDLNFEKSGGCLIQYPNADGSIPTNVQEIADAVHKSGGTLSVAADLLSLVILKEPGSLGADIVLGTAQRFGVPLGFGGPHAAYFAVRDQVKRKIPGRIIGRSIDRRGEPAYRLALQTREQHIRREKATSNICTAQALLANISAMYAVYHGPEGLKAIAQRVYSLTTYLADVIKHNDEFELVNDTWFDTLTVMVQDSDAFMKAAVDVGVNVYKVDEYHVSVSLDETVSGTDFARLCGLFGASAAPQEVSTVEVPGQFARTSTFLQQPVFNKYHSETEMLRYMTSLQNKDLSLANAMIPLGSCTMKLNATVQMMPVTFPEFSNIHPFAPFDQAAGYLELIAELESDLSNITGFAATTLQPNSGAQGEFTGLRVIQAYQKSIGQDRRNICIIPVSAHGTNPASAAMCGLKVVTVKCTAQGYLDLEDLEKKVEKYSDNLAAIMITYPSTYGSFEPTVRKAIDLVHSHGGQVYMDGANMNAQIGLTSPGDLGADVCHLNLHKTFCIPHGGGGPGVGPIGVASHLAPFLPNHDIVNMPEAHAETAIPAVSAAPWGSASILSIPWAYIKMMGNEGLKSATELAILNANYMMERLAPYYKVAFLGEGSHCAHEFIIDIRPFKSIGVEAIDVAKRLQDYSFHGPTMSWPVPNTLMIEPTESESKAELDRMCDALISIREEIREIEEGKVDYKDSVLAYAPHSLQDLVEDKWDRKYSRERAAFPVPGLRSRKHWPSVARVDDTYGDMNLFCSCDPVDAEE